MTGSPLAAALLAAFFSFPAFAQQTRGQFSSNPQISSLIQPQAASGCLVSPPGLVSWWTGDANENDILGGNNPSTVDSVTLVPGEVLDGFSFGTKGYIQIPSAANLANQQFTWSAWVRPDGAGPNNDSFGNVILIQNIDGLHDAVALHWRDTDKRFTFDFGDVNSEIIVSTDTFPTGSFYFVAGSYDGSTFRLWVNGKLEGTHAEAKTIAYSSSGWTFGSGPPAFFSTSVRTWNGVIDEIQAFNRALTQSELQSIFNAAMTGECKSPLIAAGGVISASGFGAFPSISPGSWIEIYGTGLASDTRGWTQADFTGDTAPTMLDGTSVTIGGQEAFVDYISPGQVNALVSSNTPTGPQPMTLTAPSGVTSQYTVMVNGTEPGLLAPPSFNIGGTQYVAAFFPDGTLALPTGALPGVNSRPANPGDTVTLYGVGFGPVVPSIPAGELAQQLTTLAANLQLSIGGVPANLPYSGLAPGYTGLYQFNVTVPAAATGAAPLTFTLGGNAGTQTLYLAVGN